MSIVVGAMPLHEIKTQAQAWDPARFVLTVLMAPLFLLGWLAGTVLRVFLRHVLPAVWAAGAWAAAAVLVGYRAGLDRQQST